MTMIKIDDMMPVHPAVSRLSHEAFRMYICGLCWAGVHGSARIEAAQYETLYNVVSDYVEMRPASNLARELVRAGLWEATEGGWLMLARPVPAAPPLALVPTR